MTEEEEIMQKIREMKPGELEYFFLALPQKTENVCIAALEKDGMLLRYVAKQTEKMCFVALDNNYRAFKYIKHQTRDLCLYALKKDVHIAKLINYGLLREADFIELSVQYGYDFKKRYNL